MSVGIRPSVTTGHNMFDSMYKLAYDEVGINSKESIQDGGFNNNNPIRASVFQAGQLWPYVWTRDISYAVQLALASIDPRRAKNSLLFKISYLKSCGNLQIVQDTGSGGSYPISTDRVVWAIAAYELSKYLDGRNRSEFLNVAYEAITNTIEHDRKTVFDEKDHLYRGEETFLDWREQSYPQWTWDDTIKIGISKALSTNILHFKILDVASKLAEEKGMVAEKQRYSDWAKELKEKINEEFYHDGLYCAMIFGDTCPITMKAYDLLGNALAVIFGIADDQQAISVISRYPHTQIGAPVVFPQRREITNPDKEGFNDEHGFQKPYHNMAIWPFVTAYWVKAAAKAKNPSVVERGVKLLLDKANENSSNMENYECFGGSTKTCLNSRSQLWSVAGYISMVHDVIFGLDVNQEGIRFLPFITNKMCKWFSQNNNHTIALENFSYRGKQIRVEIKLPPHQGERNGYFKIDKILLNNKSRGFDYIKWPELNETNTSGLANSIIISLLDFEETPENIRLLPDNSDDNEHWAPKEPKIESITPENGNLKINFTSTETKDKVKFNIYKNGHIQDPGGTEWVENTYQWVDRKSSDYDKNTYFYAVQAVYKKEGEKEGNVSFPSQTMCYETKDNLAVINAEKLKNVGGEDGKNEHGKKHFKNWGDRDHTLEFNGFKPEKTGNYKISLLYGNGANHFGTGITCAVKKISIKDINTGVTQEGVVEMPHLGREKINKDELERWDTWKQSSMLDVRLDSSRVYEIKIFEDHDCLNMSFFSHFNLYTGNGGGLEPYNNVNIAEIRLLFVNE